MDIQKLVADGGIRSRKLWLAVACIAVFAAMVFAALHWAALAGLYGQLVAGVVAIYSIYCGGDAARHYATVKHLGGTLALADQVEDGAK